MVVVWWQEGLGAGDSGVCRGDGSSGMVVRGQVYSGVKTKVAASNNLTEYSSPAPPLNANFGGLSSLLRPEL